LGQIYSSDDEQSLNDLPQTVETALVPIKKVG